MENYGNMKRAIYPGTFDPVTYGHLDIIERSSRIFDELVVGILVNQAKVPLFTVEERVEMIQEAVKYLPNVKVESFDGLLVEFVKAQGAGFLVRGLRAVTDFEYELQMTQTNKAVAPDIDTIFLTTSLKYSYLSSSMVRELASFGADISRFVPENVTQKIIDKYKLENRI